MLNIRRTTAARGAAPWREFGEWSGKPTMTQRLRQQAAAEAAALQHEAFANLMREQVASRNSTQRTVSGG